MAEGIDGRLRAALAGQDARALVDVGCDLADADRQDDALTCFQRAVALGEDWVWFNVGNTLRELRRPVEAVTAYEEAVAAEETDAWLNLGHVLEDLGDLAGAMRAFRAAGDVGQPEGHLALAQLLHEQGEQARADAAVAVAAGSGHLPAIALQARWRWERTRDPALEEQLRAGADVDGSARADLAELLRATGRRREARAELELGAELGQRECWLPLGDLLAGVDLIEGDPTGEGSGEGVDESAAEEAYRAGIAAGDDYCHHNLAVLLLERGDVRRAEEHLLAGAVAGDELAQRAWQALHRGGG